MTFVSEEEALKTFEENGGSFTEEELEKLRFSDLNKL